MKHVIELEDREAAVLERTGSGGLIGRGLLSDDPLADYITTHEVPKYVVRNKRGGFSVERTDADGASTEAVADPAPDGDHSAAALVTDTRVLFAVGRSDGDRTWSVPLADVVDVHVADGFLGGEIVFETVADERYRFPSRGDLAHVREFVDAAAGIWARAERQLESAEERLDRAERALESGDVDVVLAAVGEIRETLEGARETASSLEGAAGSVEERVAASRDRLTAAERRAYANQADNARERGRTRWEDHEFEAAFDHFERAEESYAAALAIDADEPDDALVERRRASLESECERLASVPQERAEHAVEAATAAEDLESEIEWYERALDRYETLHSLDWGTDKRRFDGERDAIRARLATVAADLVEARCERARRALDVLEDAPAGAASAAQARAANALEAAHELARERVPDAVDSVEALQEDLAAERERAPADEAAESTTTVADDTVVVPSEEDAVAAETEVEDSGAAPETSEPAADADSGADAAVDQDGAVPDTESGEWVFVDDQSDDKWISAERTEPTGSDDESSAEEPSPETRDASSETRDASSETRDASPETSDASSEMRDSSSSVTDGATGSGEREPRTDDSPSDLVDSVSDAAEADPDLVDSVAETLDTDITASDAAADSHADDPGSATGTGAPTAADLAAVGSQSFRTLIADLFEAGGWRTEGPSAPLSEQDFQATTPAPVSLTVAVTTVAADSAAAVDTDDVERFAAAVERASAVDHAVLVSGARLPAATRRRATERGVRLVDPERLRSAIDSPGVSLPTEWSTDS